MTLALAAILLGGLNFVIYSPVLAAEAKPQHAIAMMGAPKYPANFKFMSYVNPNAPKGGGLRFGGTGTFDSLNPFIVMGVPALGIREYVFESLMDRSYDEPFTMYALIAKSVSTPPDRSSVTFTLDPRARFSDGTPVTVEDVIFSWATLRTKGLPNRRTYYNKVIRVERPGPSQIRFVFADGSDRELPLIMSTMAVLPKHYYEKGDFAAANLRFPLGSGAYVVEAINPGRRISYKRNPNYWGKDLPLNRGRFNFDHVVFDYYRDANTAYEAFKAGHYDIRLEDDPTRWASGYDFPTRKHKVIQRVIPRGLPAIMRGFTFNTRRSVFADRRVREALTLMFDFEWANENLYHGVYTRVGGFFDNTALSARGRPASPAELKLLAPYKKEIPAHILARGYEPPKSDGSGYNRLNRLKAMQILHRAGWRLKSGILTHEKTGQRLSFEIALSSPEQEKLALTYARALKSIGVDMRVRTVDSAQYQRRIQVYDFDMIINVWDATLSPGNEMFFYWSSEAAGTKGTRNYPGIRSKAIDASIRALLTAQSRAEVITACRAFDRALMAGNYFVPLFYQPGDWLAFWDYVGFPQKMSLWGHRPDTLWDKRVQTKN